VQHPATFDAQFVLSMRLEKRRTVCFGTGKPPFFFGLEATMKTKLLVSAAAVLLAGLSAASAADLAARPYTKAPVAPVVAIYNWTGFYIGGNAGYAWSHSSGTNNLTGDFLLPGNVATYNPLYLAPVENRSSGFTGGAQAGYNWQAGSFVYGLETDINYLNNGASALVSGGGVILATTSEKDSWFGTVRGRLGFAADRVLFYGTGGLAYGEVKSSYSSVTTSPVYTWAGSSSDVRAGWTAGGGIEWAFAGNWTAKAEYLHVDLGSHTYGLTNGAANPIQTFTMTYTDTSRFDLVRVGINYRWGGQVVAKY